MPYRTVSQHRLMRCRCTVQESRPRFYRSPRQWLGHRSRRLRDRRYGYSPALELLGHSDDVPALKHYTSKLSNYDDLGTLQTFGFRGEALSSLCAVSNMHIVTAREKDAPKGTRLDFEMSGRLKGTQVVASQRGTTVAVETIFKNLPVRRQELVKNVKREYSKVLGLLQAYACITTTARISVSNVVAKGKKAVMFSTKSNQTTKDNIANIFGAKTLPALIPLDLDFEMQTSSSIARSQENAG